MRPPPAIMNQDKSPPTTGPPAARVDTSGRPLHDGTARGGEGSRVPEGEGGGADALARACRSSNQPGLARRYGSRPVRGAPGRPADSPYRGTLLAAAREEDDARRRPSAQEPWRQRCAARDRRHGRGGMCERRAYGSPSCTSAWRTGRLPRAGRGSTLSASTSLRGRHGCLLSVISMIRICSQRQPTMSTPLR